jgi:hypothetical protein
MPVFVTGMTKHAAGQSTASLTVACALKPAVSVGISVQYLNGLVLAAGATAATPRQQEERPRSDVGPRVTTNEAARNARSARSERSERSNQTRSERSNQTRRSRPHMWVCKLYPCAALSKVHNNSSPTFPYKRCPAA